MSLVLAVLVAVSFSLVLERLHLPDRAREVGRRARDSLRVLRDPTLDDLAKEQALQHQAARLSILLGILLGGSLLALGIPLFAVWLLELGGVASLGSVLAVLEQIEFLVGATVVGGVAYLLVRRISSS